MSDKRVFPLVIRKECSSKLDFINMSHLTLSLTNTEEMSNTLLNLPPAVDMRSKMVPVIDQGNLGSCTACALCSIFSYLNKQQIFSILFLYYLERTIEHTVDTDSGALLGDGIFALTNSGVCLDNIWPYIQRKFKEKPPINCYIQASAHKALSFKNVPDNLNDLKTVLLAGYPVVFGFLVFSSFTTPIVARTGQIPTPTFKDTVLGGHAAVLCGYDDSKKCFILRNSWGTGWGLKGYAYIPYDYILNTNLTTDFFIITKTS